MSQVDQLAAKIRRHRARYYAGEPEISDEAFDALEDRLRALDPKHPVLAEVGAPPEEQAGAAGKESDDPRPTKELAAELQRWAQSAYEGRPFDPRGYLGVWRTLMRRDSEHRALELVPPPTGVDWPKVRHEIPMGSLNKVNTEEEFAAWLQRCDELAEKGELPAISGALALTEKLDGLSVEVVYDAGRIAVASTRGDGQIGERISCNVMRMKGVPAKIKHKGRISVRGEILLKKSDGPGFEKMKRAVDSKFDRLKSLRNTAAGIARAKDPKLLAGVGHLTVLFYDLEGLEMESERDKLAFLEAEGFATPRLVFGNAEEMIAEHRAYEKTLRANLDYDIDGLVIRAASLRSFALLGELNHRPRAAIAFKFEHEMLVSTLREITWSTGDSGRITPVARIDPVVLAQAEVRQASLHNLAKVRSMGIGVGDQVLVSRRNDVIPYVEEVIEHVGQAEQAPTHCGSCDSEVVEDGEYLLCPNEQCPARKQGRLKTWIKHLGLLDWGEKTLELLYDLDLAHEPADLYRLEVTDIAELKGFGEKSAEKLLKPLQSQLQIPIDVFIAGLGIPGVSRETAKLLVRAGYDDVEAIADLEPEVLAELDGLGPIKAERVVRGIEARLDEIKRLREVGVVPVAPKEGGPLGNLSFCFSGSHSRPRKTLQKLVEDNGGQVRSSVTKGLDYLVLADANSTSSKAQKARKLGTQVIDEVGFDALL